MAAPDELAAGKPTTGELATTKEPATGELASPLLVARHLAWPLGDGAVADIELVVTDVPVDDVLGGAAATVVQDAEGSFLVVHSVRRGTWDCPGGRREAGESLAECALRELREETGLTVAPELLRRVGYERIATAGGQDWTARRPFVQVFSVRVPQVRPAVAASVDDVDGAEWLSPPRFEAVCGERFWWPLAKHLLGR